MIIYVKIMHIIYNHPFKIFLSQRWLLLKTVQRQFIINFLILKYIFCDNPILNIVELLLTSVIQLINMYCSVSILSRVHVVYNIFLY